MRKCLIEHRLVTDRQTDRNIQTHNGYIHPLVTYVHTYIHRAIAYAALIHCSVARKNSLLMQKYISQQLAHLKILQVGPYRQRTTSGVNLTAAYKKRSTLMFPWMTSCSAFSARPRLVSPDTFACMPCMFPTPTVAWPRYGREPAMQALLFLCRR